MPLQIFRHEFREAHRAHTRHARIVVGAVSRGPRGDAAFFVQLAQRLREGKQRVSGWRESKLAVALQAAPLGGEVEADGAGVAFGGLKQFAPTNRKAKTRHALHAFVGARNKEIKLASGKVKFHPAKCTHRIDKINAAVFLRQRTNLGDGVHNTGSGFAMHDRHMRELSPAQRGLDGDEIRQFIFRAANGLGGNAVALDDFENAFAVRAIDDDEPFTVGRRDGGNDRLDGKRAAALHQHRLPTVGLRNAGEL